MAQRLWTADEIVSATDGQLCCGSTTARFSDIATDSRHIAQGALFVAIQGSVHDGHGFAETAVKGGVNGVMVAQGKIADLPVHRWAEQGVTCIAVSDTTRALGDLAAANRHRATLTVVAITGSNGKTTTREMTAAVVSRRFNTLTPQGNYNNEIGLPLTLLSLRQDHRLAVLELGMNHFGEIRRLGQICSPDLGVITNIGPAHLEGVGSIEGVAKAKAELLETVRPGGTVVLNADDHRVDGLIVPPDHRIIRFGLSGRAHVRGRDVRLDNIGAVFTLEIGGTAVAVRLKVPGRFMVSNALAAAAVGHCLGMSADDIRAGLEAFDPVHGRMNIFSPGKRLHVIDDTYNANPESMAAAIGILASLRGNNRGIMVAGDMLELGAHAASLHRVIGEKAGKSGISRLYVTGEYAGAVAAAARTTGMDNGGIFTGTKGEILEDLMDRLQPQDWVLVKGSRGMHMEKIVEGLRTWAAGDGEPAIDDA